MGTTVAVIDFLDSREKAALLWLLGVLAFATFKSSDVISGFGDVMRSFTPKLFLVFGSAAAYCAAIVLSAKYLGLWHSTTTKETIYWFVTGGIVLVGRAVMNADPYDARFYKNLARQAVQFTILVEFLANLWVFPFLIELVVVPIILLFVMLQVVAAADSSAAAAKPLIDGVLATLGLLLLAFVVVKTVLDPSAVFTRENVEALLIAPALTLAFIPLFWLWGWISRREQDNLRKRFRAQYDSPA